MIQILVVDDDFAIIEMLQIFLEGEGYQVLTASNGREALTSLATSLPSLPSLIICDLMMPVMGGREMCRELQADPRYRAIPIILRSRLSARLKMRRARFKSSRPKHANEVGRTIMNCVMAVHPF